MKLAKRVISLVKGFVNVSLKSSKVIVPVNWKEVIVAVGIQQLRAVAAEIAKPLDAPARPGHGG